MKRRQNSRTRKAVAHKCQYYEEYASLHEIVPGDSAWARCSRWFRKQFLISTTNKRTAHYRRSSHAIELDRKHQLEKHPFMIHPFSTFRMCWEIMMLFQLIIALIATPLAMSWTDLYTIYRFTKPLLVATDLITAMDLLLHFFTGLNVSDRKDIIMRPKIVAARYFKGMFMADLLSLLPYFEILTEINTKLFPTLRMWRSLKTVTFLKNLRIIRFMIYFDSISKTFDVSYFKSRSIKLLIIILLLSHIAGCCHYFLAVYVVWIFDTQVSAKHWLGKLRLQNMTIEQQYVSSLFRVVSATSGTCFKYIDEAAIQQYLYLIFIVVGQIIYYFVIANSMHMIKAFRASRAQYEEMVTQLTQFLKSKNLPPNIIERALDFYAYRYFRSYCDEAEIMNTVSETLRQDIISHDCKQLVEEVEFFKHMPLAAKQAILMSMRSHFYQSTDTIIHRGDRGDSMYFIKSGTVAIYSAQDKEVCHLEDGNHFGEISLVLHEDRVATVVAVEDSEVYCLQRQDFLDALVHYPDALKTMISIAKRRLKQSKKN